MRDSASPWASWWSRRPFAGEIAFAVVDLPLALVGVVYVATMLYVGGLLSLTIVGLPVLAVLLWGARGLGGLHRWLVGRLLHTAITTPLPAGAADETGATDPAAGVGRASRWRRSLHWVRNHLIDAAAWRSVLYLLVRLPVAAVTLVAVMVTWAMGPYMLTVLFLAATTQGEDISFWLLLQTLVVSVALLALAPWATRVTADINRWLARALLGPTPPSPRLQALERARNEVASDATATLQRIERDLHDGTQARLVAIAVSLTLADQALDGDDRERTHELVRRARGQLRDATAELRQLTRGINPVALDGGLTEALPTLAADAGIATDVDIDLPRRPSPAIERVVYFCVAELLGNAAKHSGAESAHVALSSAGGRLRLRVSDSGRGGAMIGAGSGLRGLRDRLTTVDGTLDIASPPGGPTVVTAELPVEL